ncbi:MarR family winged helix-turn-helix transcriptional regulator [Alicyclobacillus dauci]|uniref:MarR family transcriptional regulator n=1 Tax=Alicyclobacillus dauci TaxID=1475485 RepID=A0ABY6Z9C7_9BACL|nr:MarR family transcriptional regulator [Alicyclobacillus dauci]WAH38690.1 MarR family transcriptional regulator [Alicyclobacillus dauci]
MVVREARELQWTHPFVRRFDASLHVLLNHFGPKALQHAPIGLTPGQLFMLYSIKKEGHAMVSQLARRMEVTSSAITVMLDRLEQRGLVKRMRDVEDRRAVYVELTERGDAAIEEVMEVRHRVIAQTLSELPDQEIESFITILERLAKVSETVDLKSAIASKNQMEEWP